MPSRTTFGRADFMFGRADSSFVGAVFIFPRANFPIPGAFLGFPGRFLPFSRAATDPMSPPTLLIVDDEKTTREGLRDALQDRFDVDLAQDAKAAMDLLEKEHFDVLLTDFRLPSEDGMKLITRAKSLSKPPVCILMTAYGSEELAVEAMKHGADDYIAKGRLQIEELELRIARALRQQNLEVENTTLRQQLETKFGME